MAVPDFVSNISSKEIKDIGLIHTKRKKDLENEIIFPVESVYAVLVK